MCTTWSVVPEEMGRGRMRDLRKEREWEDERDETPAMENERVAGQPRVLTSQQKSVLQEDISNT